MSTNKRRVSFRPSKNRGGGSKPRSSRQNYANHTHTASLSRRRDTFSTNTGVIAPPHPPRYYELKASKFHPGLKARGNYKQQPDNGGAFLGRVSRPHKEPREADEKSAFGNYVENLRRDRIQRQSYAFARSFPSMRTMHDIASSSPYMSTANRMRGTDRIRFKLDLRTYPLQGMGVGYADVQPMIHPPTYTAESFKALEYDSSPRQHLQPTTKYNQQRPTNRRRDDGNLARQGEFGLLGALATAVKGMAMNLVNQPPKAAQEKQVKEVIRSAAMELSAPQKEEVVLCSICLENEANMKFYPCGHEVTCESCYEVHAKRRGRGKFCPVCRSVIYSVERSGMPYLTPKTESAVRQAQALLPYMGIRSIKLREPKYPFVINDPKPANERVFTTLGQMNLGL